MPAAIRDAERIGVSNTYRNIMKRSLIMANRIERLRKSAGPALSVLARPRELFGESLPELALLTAVVAAVVGVLVALNGAG
jgi:hypothetical protein